MNTLTACSCWTAVSVAGTACACFRPWSSCTISASHTRRRICARLSHLSHWNVGLQNISWTRPVLFCAVSSLHTLLSWFGIYEYHMQKKIGAFPRLKKKNPFGIEALGTKLTKRLIWCWFTLNIILQEQVSNLSRLTRTQACVILRVCFSSLPKTSSPHSISDHRPDLPIISSHSKHTITSLHSYPYYAPTNNGFFCANAWDVRYHGFEGKCTKR